MDESFTPSIVREPACAAAGGRRCQVLTILSVIVLSLTVLVLFYDDVALWRAKRAFVRNPNDPHTIAALAGAKEKGVRVCLTVLTEHYAGKLPYGPEDARNDVLCNWAHNIIRLQGTATLPELTHFLESAAPDAAKERVLQILGSLADVRTVPAFERCLSSPSLRHVALDELDRCFPQVSASLGFSEGSSISDRVKSWKLWFHTQRERVAAAPLDPYPYGPSDRDRIVRELMGH